MKKDYKYVISMPDDGGGFEDGEEFESNSDDVQDIAQEYAEYFHGNRDGWECHWPIEFHVFDLGGKLLGRVEVQRLTVPEFWGTVL